MYLLPLCLLVSFGVEPFLKKKYPIPHPVEQAQSLIVRVFTPSSQRARPGFFLKNNIIVTSTQVIKEALSSTQVKMIDQPSRSWFKIKAQHFKEHIMLSPINGEGINISVLEVIAFSLFHDLAFLRVQKFDDIFPLLIPKYKASNENDLVYVLSLPFKDRNVVSVGKFLNNPLLNKEALEFINTPLDVFTFAPMLISSKINNLVSSLEEAVSIRSKKVPILSGSPVLNLEGQLIGVVSKRSVSLTPLIYIKHSNWVIDFLDRVLKSDPQKNLIQEINF